MTAQIGTWLLAHDWTLEAASWLLLASVISLVAFIAAGIIRLGRRAGDAVATCWHARRHVPAAPDNQSGSNTSDLWTCRRILSLPVGDPDINRRAINYLRDQQRKEDTP